MPCIIAAVAVFAPTVKLLLRACCTFLGQKYLSDKHASHIKPHSQGGSNDPKNMKWENAKDNIARGGKPMTRQEQMRLDAKWHFDNLTGAVKAGIKAVPLAAALGAATTAPFSMLTNGLRVVRGEISAQEAVLESLKDTIIGGTVGGRINQ